MSDTTRNKTVTFSGQASFAVVRALRQRIEQLATRRAAIAEDENPHSLEIRKYLTDQINEAGQALATMGAA